VTGVRNSLRVDFPVLEKFVVPEELIKVADACPAIWHADF
jgi:hypothetical protein